MEKVIRDGRVAVLYSPGYGAGWSTWMMNNDCMFDPDTVHWVENNKPGPCPYKNPDDEYLGGADDLRIEWLPIGTVFEITEYDGSESIRIIDRESNFIVA